MTRACRALGHPEVVLEIGDVPRGYGEWLVGYLEDAVAGGERFAAGETLQIGWSQLRFVAAAPGYLALEEPDMRSMPIRFVPGVARALDHLRRQSEVVKSVGLYDELELPSILDRALVCTRYQLGTSWVLARATPTPGDSGWFLGCTSERHDHNDPLTLTPISLYEAATNVPDAIDYLGLPANTQVVFGRDQLPELGRDGVELRPLPGSFLDVRARRS